MFTRTLLVAALLLTASLEAWSVGALFVRPLRSNQNFQAIAISKYDATVRIQDHVATTHVDQTFRNELNQEVEATLIFPLPDGAVITEMFYHFNGVRYKASVREKKEAQAAYDAKIRRTLDPALLQELGNNIFKLQIAPINGISDVRVEITYTEIMPFALGKSTYTHLLKTTGLSPKPLNRMSLTIQATTQSSWVAIESPSFIGSPAHSVKMVSPSEAIITLGDETFVPTKNYRLELMSKRTGVEMGTLTYVPVPSDSFGTRPFFLSWVIPPDAGENSLPRSVTFVADVSSSMTPQRMDQLRDAMLSFLEQLAPQDRFNIITFSTGVVAFREDLVDANPTNIAEARQFVQRMQALGLTNIAEALRRAVQFDYRSSTANAVVFLTDGQPSWGEQNESVIIDSLLRWNSKNVAVYPITVGEEVSLSLMRNIAKRTGGFLTEVAKDDSIAVMVRDHLRRISMPNLTNLALDYGGLSTLDVQPSVLPNVSVGGRVMQSGRYETGGTFPVTLSGTVLGLNFRLTKDVVFGDPATSNKAVARLWARARVDALLEEIGRVGERKELIDAVIALSIQFGILTKYTALYADPDDPNTATSVPDERPVETIAMTVSPHPATSASTVSVTVPQAMQGQPLTITIVDMFGRVIGELFNGPAQAGTWNLALGTWHMAPGTYMLIAHLGDQTFSQPLVMIEGVR